MKLPDLAVRRPVTIVMIFLGVILLGVISWQRLPQELFPPITYPQVTVMTSYEGAAPEEIETLLTKIVEEAVGTVSGIKRISSTSKEGLSLVVAEFAWGTNMDFAALNLREKIDLVKERLPRDSDDPIVMKYNPFDLPIMTLSISGEKSPLALREMCRKIIKDEIEKLEGVASASISGGVEREIMVEIDQARLQASGVSLINVVDALKNANVNYPAGTIKETFYEYLIRTMGEFKEVGEIKEIAAGVDEYRSSDTGRQSPVEEQKSEEDRRQKTGERRLILLKDIARIRDTTKEKTSISRYNGKDNISISIRKQSGTNTLQVANGVRESLKRVSGDLPRGIKIELVYDQSTFIKDSIFGVRDAALGGGILAFFVLLLFLHNIRSSVIVTTAIPISIMATFSLMFFNKISLNMMSLGGLALGVGMLVDNAIVVIESIFRHQERTITSQGRRPATGDRRPEAASRGANEVANAISASTLTTIAVFLPMMFVVGIAGQLFKQLAFTVTFSLLASLVVSLSLIPVLVVGGRHLSRRDGVTPKIAPLFPRRSRLRIKNKKILLYITGAKRFWLSGIKGVSSLWRRISSLIKSKGLSVRKIIIKGWSFLKGRVKRGKGIGGVRGILSLLLKHKALILILVLAIFLLSMQLLLHQEREFMPKLDQRQFIVKLDMPPGTRLELTDSVVRGIESLLLGFPEVRDVSVNIGSTEAKPGEGALETLGSHQGHILVNLKQLSRRRFKAERKGEGGKETRTRSTAQVIQYLKSCLEKQDLRGAEIEYVVQETALKAAFGEATPIVMEIKGHDLAMLKDISEEMQKGLKAIPGIYGVKTSLVSPSPETKVHINKDKASLYSLSVRDIALSTQIALKGYVATKFKEEGEEIDMRVRLRPEDRKDFSRLRKLLIHSPLDIEVPLSEVAYLAKGVGPSEIKRLDQQRVVLVTANIFGRSLDEIVDDINKNMDFKSTIPPAYSVTLGGESERMEESFKSLQFALGLAILLVYMIMAAQFESFWQPFIIIFTVPLSLIGVSWALYLTHTPLSVVVLLGVIMLGGIVVNNGIVLIDYVNTLKARGLGTYEAVIVASETRLRPIVMATLTTVLGLMPLALSLGEGAELRAPLAITVIGGLLAATFLTLVVIPAIYLLVTRPPKQESAYTPAAISPAQPPLPGEEKEKERDEDTALQEPAKDSGDILKEDAVFLDLNKRQRRVLKELKHRVRITRKDYAEMFRVSLPTASRDLKELIDKGLIRPRGRPGPRRQYELV